MEKIKVCRDFVWPGLLIYGIAVFSWLEPNVFAWEPNNRTALAVFTILAGAFTAFVGSITRNGERDA